MNPLSLKCRFEPADTITFKRLQDSIVVVVDGIGSEEKLTLSYWVPFDSFRDWSLATLTHPGLLSPDLRLDATTSLSVFDGHKQHNGYINVYSDSPNAMAHKSFYLGEAQHKEMILWLQKFVEDEMVPEAQLNVPIFGLGCHHHHSAETPMGRGSDSKEVLNEGM